MPALSTLEIDPRAQGLGHRGITEGRERGLRYTMNSPPHILTSNWALGRIFQIFLFSENDSYSNGLILVLDSAQPVKWRLSFLGESSHAYKRVLFLSQDSQVHSSNAAIASYGHLEQVNNMDRFIIEPQKLSINKTSYLRDEGVLFLLLFPLRRYLLRV